MKATKLVLSKLTSFPSFLSFQIEAVLKGCQYVDNVCVVGNSEQNKLVALVVPIPKAIETLAEGLGKIHSQNNNGVTSETKMLDKQLQINDSYDDPEVVKLVLSEMRSYGSTQGKLLRREIPAAIKIVREIWSPDNEMLTAAMKLKRRNIVKLYQADIDKLFGINSSIRNNNNNNNSVSLKM